MTPVLWIAAGLAGCLFLLIAGFNLWSLMRHPKPGQRNISPAPLIGGLLGVVAVLIAPTEHGIMHRALVAWVPLLLDPGSGFYIAFFVWCLLKQKK